MADSIPSLRRRLGDAMKRISELEARIADLMSAKNVKTSEVYVDNPEHIRTIESLQEELRKCRSISP